MHNPPTGEGRSAGGPQPLIDRLGLAPHPEGGLYRELHRSSRVVQRADDGRERSGLTVIAYLLREHETSRWHRVNGADEVWHYGAGAPLDLWCLAEGEEQARSLGLGPLSADGAGDTPLVVIPAGCWQAARSRGSWTLVYCCVGPGFAFDDFELLADLPPSQRPAGALEPWL